MTSLFSYLFFSPRCCFKSIFCVAFQFKSCVRVSFEHKKRYCCMQNLQELRSGNADIFLQLVKYSVVSRGNMLRKVDSSSIFCTNFSFAARITTEATACVSNKFEFDACDWLAQSAATRPKKTWRTVKKNLNSN